MSDDFTSGAFMFVPRENNSISVSLSLVVKYVYYHLHSFFTVIFIRMQKSQDPVEFKIRREGTGFRIDNGSRRFKTLSELVRYHAGSG